jgi:mRNA interferase RelE/StbE
MRQSIVVTKNAKKDISKLNSQTQKRIRKKLLYFIEQDKPLDYAVRLENSKHGQYRWRVGVYRIVFDVDGANIVLLRVQHRREVYK